MVKEFLKSALKFSSLPTHYKHTHIQKNTKIQIFSLRNGSVDDNLPKNNDHKNDDNEASHKTYHSFGKIRHETKVGSKTFEVFEIISM